jgi:tyrosinase
MSYVDYAAFDPIFWLHHCNIDRLTAMYQAVWPNNEIVPQAASGTFARKVNPGDLDDINTPLYPFRHPGGNDWTSVDISHAQDIFTYGYGYPEVPPQYKGQSPDQLKAFTAEKINEQYRPDLSKGTLTPAPTGGVVRREWVAHIAYDQSEIFGAFSVYFFVGNAPEQISDWSTSSELIGQCSTFGDQSSTTSHVVKGSVPLTQTLIDNNVGLGPETAVPYLKENCHWYIKQGGYSLPLSSLKSLTVGISSTQVAYSDDYTQLAQWGQAETYYEITEGTEGGLQSNQTYLVDSVPVLSNSTSNNSTAAKRYVEFRA